MLSTDIPPAARDAFAFGKLIAYVLPYIREHLLGEFLIFVFNFADNKYLAVEVCFLLLMIYFF